MVAIASERDLIRRAQQGDSAAMEALLERHLGFIIKTARGFPAGRTYDYDDLINVGRWVLARAVQRFDFAWPVKLLTYAGEGIYRQMFQLVIRELRYCHRNPKSDLMPALPLAPPDVHDERLDLADLLTKLPAKQREVIAAYWSGEQHAETARRLGISRQGVQQRFAKGMNRLRELTASLAPSVGVA